MKKTFVWTLRVRRRSVCAWGDAEATFIGWIAKENSWMRTCKTKGNRACPVYWERKLGRLYIGRGVAKWD